MKGRIALTLLLSFLLLAACSSDAPGKAGASPSSSGASSSEETESPYEGIDTSQHVKLKMFLVGPKAEDSELVMEALSERLTERINASLAVEYLPWSNYAVKYSLLLASSEQIDMIFTGDWCYYATEANKGAFFELTPEFIETYMPLTHQNHNPIAFEQAKLGGKMYMITSNAAGIEGETWIVLRGDLREKYGIAEITSIELLEAYFDSVAVNEPGVLPYAASENTPFYHIFYEQRYNQSHVSEHWYTQYTFDADIPSTRDIYYRYFSDYYLEYALKMKDYADRGYWSKSAISNTTQVRDSFENGRSASLVWNQTIFLAGAQLEKNNEAWRAEYVDLFPNTIRRATLFTNGGTAIAAISKHPERSAMCLDTLLHVPMMNDLIMGGIEGKHWIDVEGKYYQPGPDFEKYEWSHAQWGFNTPFETARISTEKSRLQIDFETRNYAHVVHPAYEMFRFSREPVKTEWAVLEALEAEYIPMLNLGITEDPAATLAEFKQKLYDSGFADIEAEFKRQYETWAAAQS